MLKKASLSLNQHKNESRLIKTFYFVQFCNRIGQVLKLKDFTKITDFDFKILSLEDDLYYGEAAKMSTSTKT